MSDYTHLIGREFVWESHDCYGLVRDFYRDVFQIELPDFARPDDFWSQGLNLFADHHYDAGFRLVEGHSSNWQFGDVILCAIESGFGNHSAVLVEGNRVLHHLYGGISTVVPYRGLVRNTTIGVYRHRDVDLLEAQAQSTADLRDFLSPTKQRRLDELRSAARTE